MDNESTVRKESERILRTRQEFFEATMESMVDVNESHAIWMDRTLGKALEAVIDRIAAVQEVVHLAGDDPDWETMPSHLRDIVWISHEAVNGTMAAYQLVRHGYWQESLVLVRHLVEVVSLMLHLCVEPRIHADFAAGNGESLNLLDLRRRSFQRWDPCTATLATMPTLCTNSS